MGFVFSGVEVVCFEKFKTEIPDEEAEKIVTFQDVLNYIRSHTNQQA